MPKFIHIVLAFCLLAALRFPAHSERSHVYLPLQEKVMLAGILKDRDSGTAIAYASVGILDEPVGTVTNETGTFTLNLHHEQKGKILRVSAIGYAPVEMKVSDLLAGTSPHTISLKAQPVELAEVKVKAATWKKKELGGNAKAFTFVHHNFSVFQRPVQENLGREMGILINNGEKHSFLSKLNFCLTNNKYDLVKFRVKVYTLQDGKPGQNITPSDIFITVGPQKKGWHQIDLEPFNLYLDQDFAIALEWVDFEPKTQNNALTLSGSLPGFHTTFYKDASQATWEKLSGVGIGLNVIVQRAD